MKKEDKGIIIEKIAATLKEYSHFYLADTTSLDAEATSALRRACFGKEIKLMVVKNTLLKKALETIDVDFTPLFPAMKGSTTLMLSNTGNAPAKLIKEVSKKNDKVRYKAAYVEESFYDASQLDALVAIKSINELIADVIAMLESPVQGVISALESGANTIHGVLETLEKK